MGIAGGWKRNAGRAARSGNLRNSARTSHQMPREGRSVRTSKMANTHLGARDVGAHARASARVTAGAQLPRTASTRTRASHSGIALPKVASTRERRQIGAKPRV
jgi:hypothetical protein